MYLPELDLWLDPPGGKPRAFVSHAHSDHFARHEALLCSTATGLLIQRRFRLAPERIEAVGMHLPLVRDGFRLRLLPAGHIAGSAMLHVTRLRDSATLLYTGDFKVRRSRTAEAISFMAADTLIMETTFGRPALVFPNPLEVEAALLRFVHDALADGATPVLCGYSLGKAQELVAVLAEHGIPTLQHPAVAAMTAACREAGVALPEPAEYAGSVLPGQVVVAPPSVIGTAWLRGLPGPRVAMATGWGVLPGARNRYRVAEIIPLSDHADHPGLLECVQRVRPRRVLTVHGYAREFAAELRTRGLDAWCAMGHDQLELAIASQPGRRAGSGLRHVRAICQLADFSDVCRLIGETSSRVAMVGFLASYLRGLENDADLALAVRWFGGDARPLRLAAITVRQAVAALPGVRAERCHECFITTRDPARAARAVVQEIQLRPQPLDLAGAAAFLAELAQTTAPLGRIARLTARLATLHPAEAETLIKLAHGHPAPDLQPETLEAAVAVAFGADPAQVRQSVVATGELAETALLARHGRLTEAVLRPLVPVGPVLASDGVAESAWWLEPDFCGVLAQLHKLGPEVALFGADRRALGGKFPGLLAAASELAGDFIVTGVIVGVPVETAAGDLFSLVQPWKLSPAPQFIAIDLLWRDGKSLLAEPLTTRQRHLADFVGEGPIRLAPAGGGSSSHSTIPTPFR